MTCGTVGVWCWKWFEATGTGYCCIVSWLRWFGWVQGYRYELWCLARASGTHYCVVLLNFLMHYGTIPFLPSKYRPILIAWAMCNINPPKHVSPRCIVLQMKQNVEHGMTTDGRRGCLPTMKICELLILLALNHFVLVLEYVFATTFRMTKRIMGCSWLVDSMTWWEGSRGLMEKIVGIPVSLNSILAKVGLRLLHYKHFGPHVSGKSSFSCFGKYASC